MSIRGHWFRGAIAGLFLGIGVALMLLLYGVVRLGELTSAWVMLGGLVFGVVWSLLAPGRPDAAPATVAMADAPAAPPPPPPGPPPPAPEPFYGDAPAQPSGEPPSET